MIHAYYLLLINILKIIKTFMLKNSIFKHRIKRNIVIMEVQDLFICKYSIKMSLIYRLVYLTVAYACVAKIRKTCSPNATKCISNIELNSTKCTFFPPK